MLDGVAAFLAVLLIPPVLTVVAIVGAFVRTSTRWPLLIVPPIGTALLIVNGHLSGVFRNTDLEAIVYPQLVVMAVLLVRSIVKQVRGDHEYEW